MVYIKMGTERVCGSESDSLSYLAESRGAREASMGTVAACFGTMSLWRISYTWFVVCAKSLDHSSSVRMAMVVCASGRKGLQILRGQLALLFSVESWSKDMLAMIHLWWEG
jgi:hypothetical protein